MVLQSAGASRPESPTAARDAAARRCSGGRTARARARDGVCSGRASDPCTHATRFSPIVPPRRWPGHSFHRTPTRMNRLERSMNSQPPPLPSPIVEGGRHPRQCCLRQSGSSPPFAEPYRVPMTWRANASTCEDWEQASVNPSPDWSARRADAVTVCVVEVLTVGRTVSSQGHRCRLELGTVAACAPDDCKAFPVELQIHLDLAQGTDLAGGNRQGGFDLRDELAGALGEGHTRQGIRRGAAGREPTGREG